VTLLLAFLIWIPKLILGFSLADWLWRDRQPSGLGFKFFLAVPLGLGLSSIFFFAWLATGLSWALYLVLEAFISLGFLIILFRDKTLCKMPANGFFSFPRLKIVSVVLTLLIAVIAFIFFLRYALQFPHGYEDAWFIWNMAARFLFRASDWALRFREQSALWHPDYPLLLPLNVVQGWALVGETTRIPMALAALFTFSIPGMLYTVLLRLRGPLLAALGSTLLLMTPWFVLYGTQQQADIPLAAFLLGAVAFLAFYLREQQLSLLILSGLVAGFAAWMKNEGWLLWVNLMGVSLTLAWREKRLQPLAAFLGGSLPPLIVILAFKILLAPESDLFVENGNLMAQLSDPVRYAQVFSAFARQISDFGGWPLGIFWFLLVFSLISGFDRGSLPIGFWLWAVFCIQIVGYFAIYIITPHDLDWHLSTSLNRLLMQIFPLALLACLASLKMILPIGEINHVTHD